MSRSGFPDTSSPPRVCWPAAMAGIRWSRRAARCGPDPDAGGIRRRYRARTRGLSEFLEPVWRLFRDHGSARVVAAAAWELGLADSDFLPRPLRPLDGGAHHRVGEAFGRRGSLTARWCQPSLTEAAATVTASHRSVRRTAPQRFRFGRWHDHGQRKALSRMDRT